MALETSVVLLRDRGQKDSQRARCPNLDEKIFVSRVCLRQVPLTLEINLLTYIYS